jgi:prepilin-type N-terminal cleavage/methylation domain-containing protein
MSPAARKGLTLVEVLMAMLVVLVAIVALVQAIILGSEMLDLSRKQTIATQMIRTHIEQTRMMDWTAFDLLAVDQDVDVTATTVYAVGSAMPAVAKDFTIRRRIELVPGKTNPNLKKVTFTVTWHGYRGRAYTRSGSTYCTKNGLNAIYQR